MPSTVKLLRQAKDRRKFAEVLRNTAPGMSFAADRDLIADRARQLEVEAISLEAQAKALDRG
jgi:hypothetical protein